jgi:transposase
MPYSSSLTVREWEIIEPLLPKRKKTKPPTSSMERGKSLVKNFERSLTHATTKINLCFVRLMLKRLAASA